MTYKQRWLALRRAMKVTADLAAQDYGITLPRRHLDLHRENQRVADVLRRLLKEDKP